MSKELTSLKKAYCVHCKTDNEMNRIFLVNPDADVCYCPSCMHEQKPKQAIEEYNYFLSQKADKADRLLFQQTKFYDAYLAFGRLIDIDSDYSRARFGRILSLVYMSRIRKSYFIDAALLLKSEADEYFSRLKDQLSYVKFLLRINRAIKEYQKNFIRRLTVKGRFYSPDCVELYFHRVYEIIYLYQTIIEQLNKTYNKTQEPKVGSIIEDVQGTLSKEQKLFEQKVVCTDGTSYKVDKIINDRHITITKLNSTVSPVTHFVKYKLNENEKKGILITDKAFPDNVFIAKVVNIALPLFILFASATVGCFVYYFLGIEELKLYFFYSGFGVSALALTSLVLFIVWKAKLVKRRHLID